jgi:hypothetical protein
VWNFNLLFAARTTQDHFRSSFLNGKMLTTARAGETDVHAKLATNKSDSITTRRDIGRAIRARQFGADTGAASKWH